MRPQFGSEPNSAVLTRLSSATVRADEDRLGLGGRAVDGDGDLLGDALSVALELLDQVARSPR